MTEFQYRVIETALAKTFFIEERGMNAFRARLRHFRNLGVPDLPKVGSGTAIRYTDDNLHQLFLALELAAFGIPPKQVASAIKEQWPYLRKDLVAALANPRDRRFLVFTPHFLGECFDGKAKDFGIWNFRALTKEDILKRHFGQYMEAGRLSIIDLTEKLMHLYECLPTVSATVVFD